MARTADIARRRERLLRLVQRLAFIGPTLARLTVGWLFFRTGLGKLENLEKVTDFFTDLHIPAPAFQARLVAVTELVGGAAMLLGLGVRFFAFPLSITMVVAILTAKRPELVSLAALFEFSEWCYLVLFIWLALAGAGPLSLDHLIARRLLNPVSTRNVENKPDTSGEAT
jgi:putative oxidoreductase